MTKDEYSFEMSIEDLSEEGVGVLLNKLYGLPVDAISSWTTIGPMIESNRIEISYNEDERVWHASCALKPESWGIRGKNPRVAVGRLLIGRRIDEDAGNCYTLKLTYEAAVELGYRMPDNVAQTYTAFGVVPAMSDVVTLELTT